MRLYIIRHADPDYDNDSLTPAGVLEAKALAEYMKEIKPDEIYSSPRGRAMETARYTAEALDLPVQVEEWAQEISEFWLPDIERVAWDIDAEQIRSPEYLADPNSWERVPHMGQPIFREIYQRIRAASDSFLSRQGFIQDGAAYKITGENRKQIAVFCHNGLGLTWLSILLDIPLPLVWSGFYLHPSSVTTILFDERTKGKATPRCIGLGALPHLHKNGLQPTPAGIKANYY